MRCLLLLFIASLAACDSTFRFGAVLSSEGRTQEMTEAKEGYQLFIETANLLSNGTGFYLGKQGTEGYHFQFEFVWRDDKSNETLHAEKVVELTEKEKVHFLGGSHPLYAAEEMRLANASGVLNYQCCVGPDVFYEYNYPTVFGIQASNKEYPKMLMRSLALTGVGTLAFIYEEENTFTRTTCEAAIELSRETGSVVEVEDAYVISTFNRSTVEPDYFSKVARTVKKKAVEAVIACVLPYEGAMLVNAVHDIQYPLKAFFLTTGPTKQDWVDSFNPQYRANDLLGAGQWHHGMQYFDTFFKSAIGYTELFEDRYKKLPTYVAAGASAVGLTLMHAIESAFSKCDISQTNGDVDALLDDVSAITCDDDDNVTGYERVLRALADLDMETFFGRVKFNYFRRNVGLSPVTTQVFERERVSGEKYRVIEPVLPLGFATQLLRYPAENHYKEDCGPGYFIGPDPFEPCVPCQQGEATDQENAEHCDSCPSGEWTDGIGQSECKKCPEGTHTEERGAKSINECLCKPGYFNTAGEKGVVCDACTEGAECEGGTRPPVPLGGYWANKTHRVNVYSCDPVSVCKGGSNIECEKGYIGRLCSACEEGYFGVIQDCYRCPNSGVIVLMLILLLFGWYIINVIVSVNVSSLEMILGWAQLANIIGDINLNWTTMVTKMFGVANLLDFDVDILEPSCLLRWGFQQNFVTQLCLPVVMTIMGCSGYLGSAIAYLAVKNGWLRPDGHRKEVLSCFVNVPENEEQLKEKWDSTIATFLASVDITYVTIAKYCFDAFKCRDIAGVSVLRVDPEVECNGRDYKSMVVLASMGIVFYVVGYLAYVVWKLYDLRERRDFSNPVNLRRYGFIYQKFELDYYYTPAIIVIRKLLFVLVLVYMNNPAFQIGAIAIIINASLMIHVYTAPYVDTYLDVLFNFLLLALMFEAFGGLMFYSENLPQADREILEWIIMISLFVLIAAFLVIFVQEMIKKYRIRLIKRAHRKFARETFSSGRMRRRRSTSGNALLKAASFASLTSHKEDSRISFELLDTFDPGFTYRCLDKDPEFIKKWDMLTNMLKEYMSDQSETSYLSMNPAAKFWRKLVDRFPELVDFLAVTDEPTRQQFISFATKLYRHFYLSKKVTPLPLMGILNWRDYAPMAQWLAIAPQEEREFFVGFVSEMFGAVGNEEAAEMLTSKLKNGGEDPDLSRRSSAGTLSQKKKKILGSLSDGTHPFHHSANEKRMKAMASAAMAVTKFRMNSKKNDAMFSTLSQVEMGTRDTLPSQEIQASEDALRKDSRVQQCPSGRGLSTQSSSQSEASSRSKTVAFNIENGDQASSSEQ